MAENSEALVPTNVKAEIVRASGADQLLARIRPEWQGKNLIDRVRRLLPVDPSSACQRLLNAAIYDLRQKVVRAGLDVAGAAAIRFKLPPVTKPEDVLEGYSTSSTIDLAYRMGLLSRPEWRRVRRAYDIRRDLEHEDGEYEADVEDILYVFKTAIEAILAKEPIELLRLGDVEQLVNSVDPAAPTQQFLEDYGVAPEPRQQEISEYLVRAALDSKKADIVRQNAVELLRSFESLTKQAVKVQLGETIQQRVGTDRLELVVAKVAAAAGVLGYLKKRQTEAFFAWLHERLVKVGHHWKMFSEHGALLDDIEDVGGLSACPPALRRQIVLWMVLCYLGEPGGYGWYGRNREVFYSNTAAPRIRRMLNAAAALVSEDLDSAMQDHRVEAAIKSKFIGRRSEQLMDIVRPDAASTESAG